MVKLTPENLTDPDKYELLAEVDHRQIKKFIFEQVIPGVPLIRLYSIYQIIMLLLMVFLIGNAVVLFVRGKADALTHIGYAVLFSFTVLILLHEFLHAVAYWLCGIRNLKVGAAWRRFIFYVTADREVIDCRTFRIVAYTPLVFIKTCCMVWGFLSWNSGLAYFFFSVMAVHSLFCAGDMALLAFFNIHKDREIYHYDDTKQGRSFFYARKQAIKHSSFS